MVQNTLQAALPAARLFDGGLRFPIAENRVSLTSSIDVEKELWSTLEYYSEVEEEGIKLIQTKGLPQPLHQEIYKCFQAFIRQAKSFYCSAKTLHYRSSSLFYYYSFLNLAKAYLLLREPESMMNRVAKLTYHGLSYRPSRSNTDFSLEVINVVRGIFPTYYEALTGTTISTGWNSTLNIVNLLGCCSDMTYQYESAGYGSRKVLNSLSGVLINTVTNESWSIIGILRSNDLDQFLSTQRNFLNAYQEVSVSYGQLTSIFQYGAADLYRNFRFFQDIIPFKVVDGMMILSDHFAKLKNALSPYLGVHYFEENIDFDLVLPYQGANISEALPITEALAIYANMFYLSSLVRYRPDYLESLLNYKPAWLIESFVSSTPETFLRIMVSKISGIDFVFHRR